MGFIDDELQDVKKLCEHVVSGSRLVSCVHAMVRVEIRRTTFKLVIVCLQFPSDYPVSPLLIELKSKTLSTKLLDGLTSVCEKEVKKISGKQQVLPVLKFIRNFIDENPLSCCYDDISAIKKELTDADELKLKQKTSSVSLKVQQGLYFLCTTIEVPDNYPEVVVRLKDSSCNFPNLFQHYFLGQAKEIARKCVEPPIKSKSKQDGYFKPSPSLYPFISFLGSVVKKFPTENCQVCKVVCLPANPQDAVLDESSENHVERIHCGHLFHNSCLVTYMKTPPFKDKKCPACGQKIYHDKWCVSEKLAEGRWAHQQARERELKEVSEFLFE